MSKAPLGRKAHGMCPWGLALGFLSSLVSYHSSHSTVINTYLLRGNYESGNVLGAEDTAIKKVAAFTSLTR